ncbi:MAG: lysophospholipase [Bacteroidetes bacterium]|nr:lysophospholipase [Bacteroidota bacterium]
MEPSEKRLTGSGGIDLYYAEWSVDAPKAIVFVVHGVADHIGRHLPLVKLLTSNGFAVAAIDLRGHGRSGGARAFVEAFDLYVSDVTLAVLRFRQHYPDTPAVVFGHSMGALIALLFDIMVKPGLGGLILSSGAFELPDPQILQKASGIIGAIAPRLPTVRIDTSKLTGDPAVNAAVNMDPLYFTGRLPSRTAAELISATEIARSHAGELTTPLLIFHGTADQITNPSGSELIYELASSRDKTLHFFSDLHHETFNEPRGDEVFELILSWLDERFVRD